MTDMPGNMLHQLATIIQERKVNPQPGSYTSKLFDDGIERIAQKVGEEATEVIVAALRQSRETQINELADLFYHTLVLMTELGLTLDDISAELARRHQPE